MKRKATTKVQRVRAGIPEPLSYRCLIPEPHSIPNGGGTLPMSPGNCHAVDAVGSKQSITYLDREETLTYLTL